MWPINPSRRHSIPVCTVFYRRVCHQEMLLGAACRPTATSWSIDCYTSPGTLLEAIIPALDPHTQPLPGNPPTASMDSCAVNPQTGQDLQCMQRSKPPPNLPFVSPRLPQHRPPCSARCLAEGFPASASLHTLRARRGLGLMRNHSRTSAIVLHFATERAERSFRAQTPSQLPELRRLMFWHSGRSVRFLAARIGD